MIATATGRKYLIVDKALIHKWTSKYAAHEQQSGSFCSNVHELCPLPLHVVETQSIDAKYRSITEYLFAIPDVSLHRASGVNHLLPRPGRSGRVC